MRLSPVVLIIVTVSSTRVLLIFSHYRTCWTQRLDWYCTNGSTTTSPATSEIDCTVCPFSSAWSTRSVCCFSSVFTRRHQSTLRGVYSDTTQLDSTQLNWTDPDEQRTAKSVVFLFMTSWSTNWVNYCSRCRVEFSWVQLCCVAINTPLHWWATRFLPPLAEVISDLQHAAIWRYLDHERRLTDKEVFPSLVRHCGTRCRSLFVIVAHLWQWRSSAHIWKLFCFAEHIVLSIAPSWQFRL